MAVAKIQLTNAGRAALPAPGNTGTAARTVVAVGIATAPFVQSRDLTVLPNERAPRITTIAGNNVAPDTLHVTIRDDSQDQYTVYGLGLYLDNGVLLGTYVQETPIMEKSPAAMMLLAADILFTDADVSNITFGDASFSNPPASTTVKGVVELADDEETKAGTDATRAVTPAGLSARLKSDMAAAAPFMAGAADAGKSGKMAREDHRHPTDTTRAPVASPSFTGQVSVTGSLNVSTIARFGNSAAVQAWITADATNAYVRTNGLMSVGSETSSLDLVAGNVARARINSRGAVMINTTTDDGVSQLQVAGTGRFDGGVRSAGLDAGGANFRAVGGSYGVFIRNDGTNVYLMQTAKDDPYGTFNSFRPFSWAVASGAIAIDQTGAGTTFGGLVVASGVQVRGTAGTQRELQFGTGPSLRLKMILDGTAETGANAGSDVFIQTFSDTGAWLANAVKIRRADGRVTIGNGLDVAGPLTVNTYPVWHSGNVNPLDKSGGTMTGPLLVAEGTQTRPGLSFANDGTPDTGLWHISDGKFGATCNGVEVARFGETGVALSLSPTAPTPPAGDNTTRLATTEFVTAAVGTASIGQIIMEIRTSARAGCLKLNGALLKRADYPVLWAYAQASGALSTEANWSAGWHGTFSTGDGATTFRLPDVRGESPRFWDDGRGVDQSRGLGSYQGPQNMSHTHGATVIGTGDHVHSAWTDQQGAHSHRSGIYRNSAIYGGGGPQDDIGENPTDPVYTNVEGAHWHTIGVAYAGAHTHGITVDANGGAEVRVRNLAVLASIRAY